MESKNKIIRSVFFEAIEPRILMSVAPPTQSEPGPPVTPPPAVNMLVLTQQPAMASVGQKLSPITVEIFDPAGNLVTGDHSDVTMSGNGLTGTTTVAAEDGVAVFGNLTITQAGNDILTATDGDLNSASTQPIAVTNTVTAGKNFAPLSVDPSTLFADALTDPKWLKIKLVNADDGKIALTRTFYPKHGQAVLVNNLSAFIAGNYNVVATDSVGDSSSLEQVTVVPAAPHELWFSSQPTVLDSDAVVSVTVLDQYGNLTTQADGSLVNLHSWLPKGTPGAPPVLTGNTQAIVVDGVATFTGLTMNETGTAHLVAHLGDLKPTVSNVFQPPSILNIGPGNGSPVS